MTTTSEPIALDQQGTGNIDVVSRLWREAFNTGDLDVLSELVHTEFTNFDRVVDGPQFLAELIGEQRSSFPDMHFETLQTVAAADWVIMKMRWTGTFLNPHSYLDLAGVEPTGRRFEVTHVHAFRVVAGKVAEHWAVRDDLTMHRQLLGAASHDLPAATAS